MRSLGSWLCFMNVVHNLKYGRNVQPILTRCVIVGAQGNDVCASMKKRS